MSMLEELWISGLDYQGRPVKKGSAMERKMVLYAKNAEKMKAMLSEQQTEQYEKTMEAFNEVVTQSEVEAFELGFTLATYTHTTTAAQHQAAAIMGNLVGTGIQEPTEAEPAIRIVGDAG